MFSLLDGFIHTKIQDFFIRHIHNYTKYDQQWNVRLLVKIQVKFQTEIEIHIALINSKHVGNHIFLDLLR